MNENKEEQLKVYSYYEDIYFEKNGVIVDKVCPKCNKIIFKDKDFCDCGFYLKANKNNSLWSALVVISTVVLVGATVLLINLQNLKYNINSNGLDFTALSPINIQVIASLKSTKYRGYIQNVYTRPDEDNKLIILIRPSLWNILGKAEKEELKGMLKENWEKVYQNKFPDSKNKTAVSFANTG